MAKKKLNEGMINNLLDKIVDSLKTGNLKRIQKKVDKDIGLSKALKDFEKSYENIKKELIDNYGEETLQKYKNMSNKEWKDKLDNISDMLK